MDDNQALIASAALLVVFVIATFSAISTVQKIVDAINEKRPSDQQEPGSSFTSFRIFRLVNEYKAMYPRENLPKVLWVSNAIRFLALVLIVVAMMVRR